MFRPAYLAAAVALVLGAAGLLAGVLPRAAPGPAGGSRPAGVSAGDITVYGAYVRQPASAGMAAAYFAVTNSGSLPDTLLDISTGAAATAVLHDLPGGPPSPVPGGGQRVPEHPPGAARSPVPGGGGQRVPEHPPAGPLTIAPGATVTLSPGHGHLMLADLTGPLRPGDRVSLLMDFQRAGRLLVEAPVVAIAAPAPTGGS
jgi:copper(I)-binding protein